MINGEFSNWFHPTAGLRQGDPISPYLFILCANVLSLQLMKAQDLKKLGGIKISRLAPPINHLCYADDFLLFFKANTESATLGKRILDAFGHMSGLFMNPHKSKVKFTSNCPPSIKNNCAAILQCQTVDRLGKYLGGFIDGPARDRQNYKFTKLNMKEVAQCDRLLSRFFWGHTPDKPGIPMISWPRLCQPKQKGGLGIRRFDPLNRALLGKQYWRVLTQPHTLLHRVFRARPHCLAGGRWNRSRLNRVYEPSRVRQISEIPVSHYNVPDLLIWKLAPHVITIEDDKYTFGCDTIEDEEHLFKDCPFARAVWFGSSISFVGRRWVNDSFCQSVTSWCNLDFKHLVTGQSILHEVIVTCWGIYTQRNKVLFSQETPDPAGVVRKSQNFLLTLQHIETLPSLDPFFNLQNMPSSRFNTMSNTGMTDVETINLFCCWFNCRQTKKREAHILWQQHDRITPLLIFTPHYSSEAYLVMLQAIRQALVCFSHNHQLRISIHIPNRQLFK
ncbi:ribonuclease H [Senna tora]|uniref:Ribonuclease H n=1 Tax=Senna tora TaxID=362788 RepID=A0A834WFF7_9FABA|nr:ribonuclease H [Senna tora]